MTVYTAECAFIYLFVCLKSEHEISFYFNLIVEVIYFGSFLHVCLPGSGEIVSVGFVK